MFARKVAAKEAQSGKTAKVRGERSSEDPVAKQETEETFAPTTFPWSLRNVALFHPAHGGRPHPGGAGKPRGKRFRGGLPLLMQAKLEVGAEEDPLEREAAAVAAQVMRMPDSAENVSPNTSHASPKVHEGAPAASVHAAPLHRKCDCGGTCGKCKAEQSGDEHSTVQRKPAAPQISRASSPMAGGMEAPPVVHEVLRSLGRPLDQPTRAFFEPRFGYDFSRVRIHTDALAAQSARNVNAHAYTAGQNIVFRSGQYAPATLEGKKLLAHELAHTLQQRGSAPGLQRSPDPPESGELILGGGPSTKETVNLYHYGDLEDRDTFTSTPGFPRLTDYDSGGSQKDAAEYTGAPISPRLRFRYELTVDREYFEKHFINTGSRKGYSEYGTKQAIPVKYFKKVAALTLSPRGGGGSTPGPGGGGPPRSSDPSGEAKVEQASEQAPAPKTSGKTATGGKLPGKTASGGGGKTPAPVHPPAQETSGETTTGGKLPGKTASGGGGKTPAPVHPPAQETSGETTTGGKLPAPAAVEKTGGEETHTPSVKPQSSMDVEVGIDPAAAAGAVADILSVIFGPYLFPNAQENYANRIKELETELEPTIETRMRALLQTEAPRIAELGSGGEQLFINVKLSLWDQYSDVTGVPPIPSMSFEDMTISAKNMNETQPSHSFGDIARCREIGRCRTYRTYSIPVSPAVQKDAVRRMRDVGVSNLKNFNSLADSLNNSSDKVRLSAVLGIYRLAKDLGSLHGPAIQRLIPVLRDENDLVRATAAAALQKLGATEAIPFIRKALGETDDKDMKNIIQKSLDQLEKQKGSK